MEPQNSDLPAVQHNPPDVRAEVEVVYLAPNRLRGLVATAFDEGRSDERTSLPRGWLLPRESPAEAAERVLRDIARIRRVPHVPELLGAWAHPDRQNDGPVVSLAFVVVGPVPSDGAVNSRIVAVHQPERALAASTIRSEVLTAANRMARTLVETLPIVPHLLGRHFAAFTLADLQAKYQEVLGPDVKIDDANFRRKVQAAEGFIVAVEPPENAPNRSGRRPQWYTLGQATTIDPPIRFRP